MPLLLEDLAEETSASNLRATERMDAEVRSLEQGRQTLAGLEELRMQVVASARQATDYALARLPQAESQWRLVLAALRQQPVGNEAERLLRTHLKLFESGRPLVRSPLALWELAAQLGAVPERLDELEKAATRFAELAEEARQALEHRQRTWQPADSARLAQGMQFASEGQTIPEDEARSRFRTMPG